MKQQLIAQIRDIEKFYKTSTRCLAERDSTFRPTPGMMTVAEQVAHTAQTVDWFVDGITNPKGFDLDFEKHLSEVRKCTSLTDAREWFRKAIARAVETIERMSEEELRAPLPAGPVMGGAPKLAVVSAMNDHTAHHRGALTVYSRLLEKVPDMPYA